MAVNSWLAKIMLLKKTCQLDAPNLGGRFGYFLLFLLVEGEGESEAPGGGGFGFFLWKIPGGGGVSKTGRPRGREGVCGELGNRGGG